MERKFTSESLPQAIKSLFEQNNYIVTGPEQIHGAEVDLIARPKGDPFGAAVYIEATVSYVDNDKYGNDLSKLAMIHINEPLARCLIVSTKGFSLPVKERANATRIDTFTYNELFSKFERFEPYIKTVLGDNNVGQRLTELNNIYEEPFFEDALGKAGATEFLTSWRDNKNSEKRWLIIIGEYGTGKTALTQVLQYRWSTDYQHNASLPIPFRIELRDFTRQFNA
jgi:chromosomal replication initiation ATPase DnaA